MGGGPGSMRFFSGAVVGDAVTLELLGSSGGHGVTVHDVHWRATGSTSSGGGGAGSAFAGASDCDLSVVVPEGLRDTEGGAQTSFPWGTSNSMRIMYSYGKDASGLDRIVRICGIRYRPDQTYSSFNGAAFDFRLEVSTGRSPANNLSFTFDNNHGADKTVAFDGVLNVPVGVGLGTSPNPFVLTVPFDTPFEWDPSNGPLLFDFHHRGATGGPLLQWDVTTTAPDAGRIAATNSSANAPVANFPSGGNTQLASLVVDLCLESQTVPTVSTGVIGNSSSRYPFGRSTPMRVQYIYDESAVDLVGRNKIHSLSFRPKNGVAFPGDSYDMVITMSTSPAAASAASSTFATNHGSDQVTVFDGIYVAPPTPAGTSPGRFELTIPLDRGFEYHPANGPLVIDIQLQVGVTSTAAFDGVFNSEPVYRVFSTGSASALTGTVQQFGLVLGLNAEPIPTMPESNNSSAGSSSSGFPWDAVPMRAMYHYDASTLATDEPIYIQHMSWRPRNSPNATFGPAAYTCTIDLSTSSSALPLDLTFDNNHGSDRARVFAGTFSVPYLDDLSDPSAYPITVKLDEPFFYDPATGPLLVDLRVLDTMGLTGSVDGSFGSGLGRIANQTDPNAFVATFGPQGFALSLRLTGETCNATSVPYGQACAGSNGTPACVNHGLPTLPTDDFRIRLLRGAPNSAGFLILALTESAIPLDVLGAPGCFGLTGGEIGAEGFALDAAGEAVKLLVLPNNPAFTGLQFMTQWAVLDLPVNALGLTFSNALRHTTCF